MIWLRKFQSTEQSRKVISPARWGCYGSWLGVSHLLHDQSNINFLQRSAKTAVVVVGGAGDSDGGVVGATAVVAAAPTNAFVITLQQPR